MAEAGAQAHRQHRQRLPRPGARRRVQRAGARAARRGPEVEDGLRRLAAPRTAGVPLLSHDDASPEERACSRAMGSRVSEFPKTLATAQAARAHGEEVVMGAPNVLRGRSQFGWVSAAEAVAAGACTVLVSD